MFKRTLGWILIASCWGGAVAVQAQQFIYKWTDSQGQVQYSELAPPAGVKYEMVRKPAGAEQNPAADRDLNKEQENLAKQVAEQEQKDKEQTEQAQKEVEDVRAKNCEIAKRNVVALQGTGSVVKTDAKGNKVPLDAEERAAQLKKAQKDQDYYCNP